jgi:hypothetical protein
MRDGDCRADVCGEPHCETGLCTTELKTEGTELGAEMQMSGDCRKKLCSADGSRATFRTTPTRLATTATLVTYNDVSKARARPRTRQTAPRAMARGSVRLGAARLVVSRAVWVSILTACMCPSAGI